MNRLYLGFDTSNYTTSLAVCSADGVLFHSKKMLSVASGQRGLRQQEAVFQHVKNLPELFSGFDLSSGQPAAVGVSVRPRNLPGSYMPCFTVGESFAKVTAAAFGIPVYSFSHQQGHIAAGLFSAGKMNLLDRPFLAFHLSGGTSELLFVDGIGGISILSSTDDITFGQLIDRCGVFLGMSFPCGAEMDRLFSENIPLAEKPKFSFRNGNLSLSGFENKIHAFGEKGFSPQEIVRYTFEVAVSGISEMIRRLPPDYADLPLLFIGGVSSNRYLRRVFAEDGRFLFAEPAFSCDNALGLAALAAYTHQKGGL